MNHKSSDSRRKNRMNSKEKIAAIQYVIHHPGSETVYSKLLDDMGDLRTNYGDYMTTAPIRCDEELKRIPEADYELCTALLTMLLREDHFSEGSFMKRYEAGLISQILKTLKFAKCIGAYICCPQMLEIFPGSSNKGKYSRKDGLISII